MSRFVSAGTAEDPPERDDDWLNAQKELEANRRLKREQEQGRQDEGKSLYEVLQANKVAKQDAFEESIRLKNQFRSLDEDEVDFLDSVLESTRAKDEAVKRETTEQLDAFRRQQEEAEKLARAVEQGGDTVLIEKEEQWHTSGRKRKKGKGKEAVRGGGLKLRKTSSAAAESAAAEKATVEDTVASRSQSKDTAPAQSGPGNSETKEPSEVAKPSPPHKEPKPTPKPKPSVAPALGLGDYSSDDD